MKISVITVVRNDSLNIEKTILSCISQKNVDLEYIVINGLSNDGTTEIIEKYSDSIDFSINERDRGIYDAMNKGIEVSTGEWIIFMNSGDLFYSDSSLESIFNEGKNDFSIIIGSFVESNNPNTIYYPRKSIKYGMPGCHQSIFVKSYFAKKLKFNVSYKVGADFDMISKILLDRKNKSFLTNEIISIINPDGYGRNVELYKKDYLKIIRINFGFFHYLKYKLHSITWICFFVAKFKNLLNINSKAS